MRTTFGKDMGCLKRKDKVGATPKGQSRPERPMTAGGHRRLSGAGSFLKVAVTANDYSGCVGVVKVARRRKVRLQMSASPRTTMRQRERTYDIRDWEALERGFSGTSTEKKERDRVYKAATGSRWHSKGSASPTATNDSWRATTPFWSGRLFKEDIETHWRRHTIKTAMKGGKATRRGW